MCLSTSSLSYRAGLSVGSRDKPILRSAQLRNESGAAATRRVAKRARLKKRIISSVLRPKPAQKHRSPAPVSHPPVGGRAALPGAQARRLLSLPGVPAPNPTPHRSDKHRQTPDGVRRGVALYTFGGILFRQSFYLSVFQFPRKMLACLFAQPAFFAFSNPCTQSETW